MDDEKKEIEKSNEPTNTNGIKEKLYDKIPLTKTQLDIIIVLLVIAFAVFFVLGALKGNRII